MMCLNFKKACSQAAS